MTDECVCALKIFFHACICYNNLSAIKKKNECVDGVTYVTYLIISLSCPSRVRQVMRAIIQRVSSASVTGLYVFDKCLPTS